MLSINWRRGLFRLWIAASFVWLVSAGALLQEDIRRDVSTLRLPVSSFPEGATLIEPPAAKRVVRELQPDEEIFVTVLMSQRAQGNLMFAASVLLLPPILAFALGWAGLWIMRGFRS